MVFRVIMSLIWNTDPTTRAPFNLEIIFKMILLLVMAISLKTKKLHTYNFFYKRFFITNT